MFEAHPSIQRRTYEPSMASSPSFGLGGSTNHSLRDVGLAEPSQEVDRPIASQGNEIDRRSFYALPVPSKPHIRMSSLLLCRAPHTLSACVYLSSAQSLNRVYLKSCYRLLTSTEWLATRRKFSKNSTLKLHIFLWFYQRDTIAKLTAGTVLL